MGKIKIQKKDVWIDMTPMSDVMTLLLCFFMLTSTFLQPEPIKVNTPNSVSEAKVPENDVLTILVGNDGKIFLGTENKNNMNAMLQTVADKFGLSFNSQQLKNFSQESMFGAPISALGDYLSLEKEQMAEAIKSLGIPTDSIDGGMQMECLGYSAYHVDLGKIIVRVKYADHVARAKFYAFVHGIVNATIALRDIMQPSLK